MNNKGFAITTILYGLLILFLMLLVSMLGILGTYKDRVEMLIENTNGARSILDKSCEIGGSSSEEEADYVFSLKCDNKTYGEEPYNFTYYGNCDYVYNEESGDWKIKLYRAEDGYEKTFVSKIGVKIDVFLVGGGGGGTEGGAQKGGGGGGGGYVYTAKDVTLVANDGYILKIGAGGVGGHMDSSAEKGGTTSGFGYSVEGGDPAKRLDWVHGANGGSGGGSGGYYYSGRTEQPGKGGSYGGAGVSGFGDGGTGQGVGKTCEFSEYDEDAKKCKCSEPDTDDCAYAGGGGGAGGYAGGAAYAAGGAGGGGRGGTSGGASDGYSGVANTGGGGGGGGNGSVGGSGGSGIIIIRGKAK